MNVPPLIVTHLEAVKHTYDEAGQVKKILTEYQADSLILVADR